MDLSFIAVILIITLSLCKEGISHNLFWKVQELGPKVDRHSKITEPIFLPKGLEGALKSKVLIFRNQSSSNNTPAFRSFRNLTVKLNLFA